MMLELLFPRHCAGCGAAGETVCAACRRTLARPPQRIFTTVDPHLPVWALAPYAGAHREFILGMKERGRRDVPKYLGAVMTSAAQYLAARGEIPEPEELCIVPAPTKVSAARLRGGDPMTAVGRAMGLVMTPCVRHRPGVRESVGLDAQSRMRNLSGNIELLGKPTAPVLLIDDVVTTGSTLAATAAVLFSAKVQVVGALSICYA